MFGGWRSDMPDDYYESVPSLLVELSLPASDSRIRPLREFGDRWAAFDLGESGMRDIDVFRDRFDLEPVVARISDAPKSVLGQLSKQLSTVCDMGCWPDPGASRLDGLLSSLPPIRQLIPFDAGQRSATCLDLECLCLPCCDALDLVRQATDSCDEPSSACECYCYCSDTVCPCSFPRLLHRLGLRRQQDPSIWRFDAACPRRYCTRHLEWVSRSSHIPLGAGDSGRNASGLIMRVRIDATTRIGSPMGASLAHDAPLSADHNGLLEWISLQWNFLVRAVHKLSLEGGS